MPEQPHSPTKPDNRAPDGASPDNAPAKPDTSHDWVGAAIVNLTLKKAKRALKYQSYRADEGEKINVLDIYCSGCRLNMEDVQDEPCSAKIDNRHLIGGDQSVRAKRKRAPMPAHAVPLPAPVINRRGIDAVIRGEA